MVQYADALIAVMVGFYAVLLGLGRPLPPVLLRGRRVVLILGIFMAIGGLATAVWHFKPTPEKMAERAVVGMKKKLTFPVRIDDDTQLTDIKSEQAAVVYLVKIFKPAVAAQSVVEKMSANIAASACANRDYKTLLHAGISVELRYRDVSDKAYPAVVITPKKCGM